MKTIDLLKTSTQQPIMLAVCAGRMIALLSAFFICAKMQASYYSDTVLSDNPVVYYQFQGTGSTVSDSGSAGLTGNSTATQGTAGPSDAGFGVGNTGVTIVQDTTSASEFVSLSTASVASALNGSTSVTAEMWINPDTIVGNQSIFAIPATLTGGYGAGFTLDLYNSNGDIRFTSRSQLSDAFQMNVFDANVTAGTWTHIVAISNYTAGTVELYVNGTSLGTQSVNFASDTLNIAGNNSSPSGSATNSFLGRNGLIGSAATSYGGDIDEFALYDYALSSGDILSHYSSAIPESATIASLMGSVAFMSVFVLRRRRD